MMTLDTTGSQAIAGALTASDGGADDTTGQQGHLVAGPLLAGGSADAGWRVGADEAASNHIVAHGVSMRGRDGGIFPELEEEVSASLRTGGGGADKAHVLIEGDVATTLRARDGSRGVDSDATDTLIVDVAGSLNSGYGRRGHPSPDEASLLVPDVTHTLRGEGFDASEDGTGRGVPLVPDVVGTLLAGGNATGGTRPPGTTVDTMDYLVAVPEVSLAVTANMQRQDGLAETLIPFDPTQITHPENRANPQPGDPAPTLPKEAKPPAIAYQMDAPIAFSSTENHSSGHNVDVSPTLKVGSNGGGQPPAIAFNWQNGSNQTNLGFDPDADTTGTLQAATTPAIAFQERGRPDGRTLEVGGDVAYALTAPKDGGRAQERNVATRTGVRRLTPTECERLQGFPDGWTLIPWKAGRLVVEQDMFGAVECPDGPRYRAIGNSMAVPVMGWIGRRIQLVDQLVADLQLVDGVWQLPPGGAA